LNKSKVIGIDYVKLVNSAIRYIFELYLSQSS